MNHIFLYQDNNIFVNTVHPIFI